MQFTSSAAISAIKPQTLEKRRPLENELMFTFHHAEKEQEQTFLISMSSNATKKENQGPTSRSGL